VNARNGESGINDSKGLAAARARGLVNARSGQEWLPRQFLPKCTFSVGIVAMAHIGSEFGASRRVTLPRQTEPGGKLEHHLEEGPSLARDDPPDNMVSR
jgi:hypothetical protein